VAYAFYASENNVNFYDVVMSTSLDNGGTWSTPQDVVHANDIGIGVSNGTVDANASSPFANAIYIVEGVGNRGTGGQSINVLSSHNGGRSFRTVNVQPDTTMTIWGSYEEIVTGKDGTVYLTYRLCNTANGTPCKIMFSRSTNGGTTWTKPRAAATVRAAPNQVWPNTDVNGQHYSVYQPGVIAVDNSNGRFAGKLYMVTYNWTGSIVQVVLTSSTNGGKTWGPLVPLAPITNDQFWPWMSVSSTGAVGVTWLDRRDDPENLKYRAYLAISTDGGTTFGKNLPIDDGLEDPTNVMAGILSTRNAWVGHALYTTWFSHGDTMGTVVGGVQFK
jgi:Neuraminidase (sialidase)